VTKVTSYITLVAYAKSKRRKPPAVRAASSCAASRAGSVCTPGGTRTHNTRILSPLPLPIGLLGRPVHGIPSEPGEWLGVAEGAVDAAGPQGSGSSWKWSPQPPRAAATPSDGSRNEAETAGSIRGCRAGRCRSPPRRWPGQWFRASARTDAVALQPRGDADGPEAQELVLTHPAARADDMAHDFAGVPPRC
jgi:hypothetical protein